MDERLLLRLTDYLAAMLIGVLSALLPKLFLPHHWPMLILMPLGMAIAMLAAFIAANLLARFAGPFEAAMPGMVISMTVGMMPMHGVGGFSSAVIFGAGAGAIIQAGFHLYDLFLHGEVNGPGRTD